MARQRSLLATFFVLMMLAADSDVHGQPDTCPAA